MKRRLWYLSEGRSVPLAIGVEVQVYAKVGTSLLKNDGSPKMKKIVAPKSSVLRSEYPRLVASGRRASTKSPAEADPARREHASRGPKPTDAACCVEPVRIRLAPSQRSSGRRNLCALPSQSSRRAVQVCASHQLISAARRTATSHRPPGEFASRCLSPPTHFW